MCSPSSTAPCVTTHMFDSPRNSGFLWVSATDTRIFLHGLCAGKVHLSNGYWYPKRKLGVSMHFSAVIEIQFGKKKTPTLLCILQLFRFYSIVANYL